jgi:hypothetical protein
LKKSQKRNIFKNLYKFSPNLKSVIPSIYEDKEDMALTPLQLFKSSPRKSLSDEPPPPAYIPDPPVPPPPPVPPVEPTSLHSSFTLQLTDSASVSQESETNSSSHKQLTSHSNKKHSPKPSRFSTETSVPEEESSGDPNPPPPKYIPKYPLVEKKGKEGPPPPSYIPSVPPSLKQSPILSRSISRTDDSESGSHSKKGSRNTLDIPKDIIKRKRERISSRSNSQNSKQSEIES